MGKLYGQKPSHYFDLDDRPIECAIDYACACAHWVDENQKNKEAKERAKSEAGEIGNVLNQVNEEMQGRS